MPLWARKCSEGLVRGSCNYFAVTTEKGPCVIDGLAGLSLCVCVFVCVYVYIYLYMCVYIYIYINNMDMPLWARKFLEGLVRGSCNIFAVTADKGPCVFDRIPGLFLCVCVFIHIYK
jgi:hypothetical protein